MKIKLKEKILNRLDGVKKYKITIELETKEEIKPIDFPKLLDGCWLYDEGFDGAITKSKIEEIK